MPSLKPFQTFGNCIIGWKVDTGKAFAGMLRNFIPPPAVIVDLCAGERRMYRKLNNGHTLIGDDYKFIFGDIRNLKGLDIICDIKNPPKELFNSADGFIFDAPYPSHSGTLGKMVKKYCPLDEKDFEQFVKDSIPSIKNILKDKGVLICKIKHPWNHKYYQWFLENGFDWIRDIPQISIYHGVYLVSYFMVFKKRSGN
jgi:hypothetical protein